MMGAIENLRNPSIGPMDTISRSWKLYDNPHYSDCCHNSPPQEHPHNCLPVLHVLHSASKLKSSLRDLTSFFRPMGCKTASSELDLARAQIRELKAELEFERRLRRKVESLNKVLARELSDERKRREATESLCKQLTEEISCNRAETNRVVKEVEEERRMLRIAEVWREERVRMKLTEARLLMEEKLQELSSRPKPDISNVGEKVDSLKILALPSIIGDPSENPGCSGSNSSIVGSTSQHSQHSQQRREVENPHIKRGIKGFVEFPRVFRFRANLNMGSFPSSSKEGRGEFGPKLECQKAQMRILLRHRNPVSFSLMGASGNLVM